MKDLIARIYESIFYDSTYQLVFDKLYNYGGIFNGYNTFFLIALIIPIIVMSIFYFVYKNPLAGRKTWFIWWIGAGIIVIGLTYLSMKHIIYTPLPGNEEDEELLNYLADVTTGFGDFLDTLSIWIAVYNGLLALLIGFIYSLLIKHKSNQFPHLPL